VLELAHGGRASPPAVTGRDRPGDRAGSVGGAALG
jgi:hypothetical protein